MKKTMFSLLVAAITMFSATQVSAQRGISPCVTDTSNCNGVFGAACPATLPNAVVGTFYEQTVTVFIPAQVDTVFPIIGLVTATVDTANFIGITGLPSGLSFQTNNGVTQFLPRNNDPNSRFFCLKIYGNPCGGNDTIRATLSLLYAASALGNAVDFPISFPVTFVLESNSPVLDITGTEEYLCSSGPASTSTLTAQVGFTTYNWSNAQTSNEIVVSSAGVYNLEAIDAAGCTQTDSFEVKALQAFTGGSAVTICENQILPLQGSGGSSFSWFPAVNLTSTSTANTVAYDLTANQTYNLVVSNGTCFDTSSIAVTVQACTSDCDASVPERNCTPGAGEIGAVCPGALPTITAGVAYNAEVEFFFPGSIPLNDVVAAIVGAPIPGLPNIDIVPSFIDIVDIGNLPLGLSWSTDQLSLNGTEDGRYYPALAPIAQYGTIALCGITCAPAKTNDTIFITVGVTAFLPAAVPIIGGSEQSFDFEFPVAYTINYTNPLEVNATQTGVLPFGTPVSLFIDPTGFTNISWSTGSTNDSITVNTSGTYTVSANDGACTQSVTYEVQYASSIENIDVASVNIFPNPNQGNFGIDFNMKKSADVEVAVFNMQGKEVYTETFAGKAGLNNKAVQMSNLSQGIYMLKLKADGNAVTKRVTLF